METLSLNKEQVTQVVQDNPTALEIFSDLNARQRIRHEMNLDQYFVKLVNKGKKIVPDQFSKTFKDLEKLGLGALVYGRGGNPTRWKWYYSLKHVANAFTHPEQPQKLEPLPNEVLKPIRRRKRGPGRPKGSKNRPKVLASEAPAVKRTMAGQPGVIFTVKTLEGGSAGISVEEAFRIADQVNQIRAITTKATA